MFNISHLLIENFYKIKSYYKIIYKDGNTSNTHLSNLIPLSREEWDEYIKYKISLSKSNKRLNNHRSKPIVIDNKTYNSASQAARKLQIPLSTLNKRYRTKDELTLINGNIFVYL